MSRPSIAKRALQVLATACLILVCISVPVCLYFQAQPRFNKFTTLSLSRSVVQIEWTVVGPVVFALVCYGFFCGADNADPNSGSNRLRTSQPDRWKAIGLLRAVFAALAFMLTSSEICRFSVPHAGGSTARLRGEVSSIVTNAETYRKSQSLFPCDKYVNIIVAQAEERLCYLPKGEASSPISVASLQPGQRITLQTRTNFLGVYVAALRPEL